MNYTEPKVRGVRWADIMDALDSEDVPLSPTVSKRKRSPSPPRRTLKSTIERRKQSHGTGASPSVHSARDENPSGVHKPSND